MARIELVSIALRGAIRRGAFLLVGIVLCACMPAIPSAPPEQLWNENSILSNRLPRGTVFGFVRDAATGRGLAGVTIRIQNVEPVVAAISDEDGAFVLQEVPQGKQIVVAEKVGFTAPLRALIADVMPNTANQQGTFEMRPVVAAPSPTPTPRQWMRAQFTKARGVNADTSAFDTERRDGEGDVPVSGGVFAMWRDQNNYSQPHPRAFVVEARWTVGMAPPPAKDRAIELRFLAPPTAGKRFALGTEAVSDARVQLRYLQGYRFRQDAWAATRGSLVVTAAEGGTLRLVIDDATMGPDPRGEHFQSEATGTFSLNGEGVVLPRDQSGQSASAPPTSTPSPSPAEPDLNGIWTFALPDGTQTPIPACGAMYRQFVFDDADRDGRDIAVRVREMAPPGSATPTLGSWALTGGLVDGHYEFGGDMPVTGADGRPTTVREFIRLEYDAAKGMLVGSRQVGASVAEGGRGALPIELVRARFEAPPPEGCPSPDVR